MPNWKGQNWYKENFQVFERSLWNNRMLKKKFFFNVPLPPWNKLKGRKIENVMPITRVLSQPVPYQNSPRITTLLHSSRLSRLKSSPLINSLAVWDSTVFWRQAWNSRLLMMGQFPTGRPSGRGGQTSPIWGFILQEPQDLTIPKDELKGNRRIWKTVKAIFFSQHKLKTGVSLIFLTLINFELSASIHND